MGSEYILYVFEHRWRWTGMPSPGQISWKQVGMMPWWDKDIIIQKRRAEVSHSKKNQITWFCAVCLSEWPESMMHNMWCDSMSTHTNGPGLPPHSYSTDPCRTRLQRETQRERYLKATVHPKLKMIISHHHIILIYVFLFFYIEYHIVYILFVFFVILWILIAIDSIHFNLFYGKEQFIIFFI